MVIWRVWVWGSCMSRTVHVCMLIIYFYVGDDLDLNLIKAKNTLVFSIWRIRIFNWNIILSKFLFSRGGVNGSSEGWATLNLHPTRNMWWLAWIRIWLGYGARSGKNWSDPLTCHKSSLHLILITCQTLKFRAHIIGNGTQTVFWFDPWFPDGSLFDRFGTSLIHDLGLGDKLKVSTFIENCKWNTPHSAVGHLIEIFHSIHAFKQPATKLNDEIIWTAEDNNGRLTIRSLLQTLHADLQIVPWYDLTWFKGGINKHSICMWMATERGLETRDLLAKRISIPDHRCTLCSASDETCNHLFLDCP